MSESDINFLEIKNNDAIAAILDLIQTSIPQALSATQIKDAETTIIVHKSNKTIRFKLDKVLEQEMKTNWPRCKAKPKELIRAEWTSTKLDEKQKRKRILRDHVVPSIMVDSGATLTFIREVDEAYA